MPRLTTPTYLLHHYQLKALWTTDQSRFTFLSWKDQLDLHRYYLLALDKTELELANHRCDVHVGDLSLPQRAGRVYARLIRGEKAKVSYSVTPSGRVVAVRPLMRPEPDVKLLAQVFLEMAMRDLEKESEDQPAA